MNPAKRLEHIKEYYFSRKLKEVAAMITDGKPVINMGIGSPDLDPPQEVVTALQRAMTHPKAHQYQSYIGVPQLREAMASFYEANYGVLLNSATEVLPLMGSKEGIMHISMAFLNPGDEVLIPNPGYPTYTSVTALVEAHPGYYELEATSGWLPDLDALAKQDLSKVKLMWLNYPHMPTGATASSAFYKEVIAFAKAYNILIVNDNPYSFIGSNQPRSILAHSGAKDVAIELNSLSKTFNMAGWRVGMVLGNAGLISQIIKVKSNMDSGMFYGIQMGAIAALQTPASWITTLNTTYRKRRKAMLALVDKLGCIAAPQSAGLFVWARLPEGQTSEAFIEHLLQEKHVFITPGTIFGSRGEGYIRLSLCVPEAKIEEALKRL